MSCCPYNNQANPAITAPARALPILLAEGREAAPVNAVGAAEVVADMVMAAVLLGAMLDADMLADIVLALELLLPVESMPPITPPFGATLLGAEDAADMNFARVMSDPLGLVAESVSQRLKDERETGEIVRIDDGHHAGLTVGVLGAVDPNWISVAKSNCEVFALGVGCVSLAPWNEKYGSLERRGTLTASPLAVGTKPENIPPLMGMQGLA